MTADGFRPGDNARLLLAPKELSLRDSTNIAERIAPINVGRRPQFRIIGPNSVQSVGSFAHMVGGRAAMRLVVQSAMAMQPWNRRQQGPSEPIVAAKEAAERRASSLSCPSRCMTSPVRQTAGTVRAAGTACNQGKYVGA
jgi:hypothetical protein